MVQMEKLILYIHKPEILKQLSTANVIYIYYKLYIEK